LYAFELKKVKTANPIQIHSFYNGIVIAFTIFLQMSKKLSQSNASQFLLYQNEDGTTKLDIRFDEKFAEILEKDH